MNYPSLPNWFSFSLADLQRLNALKVSSAKKLIKSHKITAFRVGNKLFITREELVRYFNSTLTSNEIGA